jgi:hypothetical protein
LRFEFERGGRSEERERTRRQREKERTRRQREKEETKRERENWERARGKILFFFSRLMLSSHITPFAFFCSLVCLDLQCKCNSVSGFYTEARRERERNENFSRFANSTSLSNPQH